MKNVSLVQKKKTIKDILFVPDGHDFLQVWYKTSLLLQTFFKKVFWSSIWLMISSYNDAQLLHKPAVRNKVWRWRTSLQTLEQRTHSWPGFGFCHHTAKPTLNHMLVMDGCLFCAISFGYCPTWWTYESNEWLKSLSALCSQWNRRTSGNFCWSKQSLSASGIACLKSSTLRRFV